MVITKSERDFMHKKYDFSLFCIETREFDAMTTIGIA